MCSIVGEQIERPFSVLVNPGFAYTIGPNSKHNITYDHVKHLPMFDAVEETLMAGFGDTVEMLPYTALVSSRDALMLHFPKIGICVSDGSMFLG